MHIEVVDQQQDVGSPDADRVQISIESKGDLARLVDLVATNPSMGVVVSTTWRGLGSSKVGQCRRRAVLKARVRSALVVVGSEGVEEPLELDDRGWLDLLGPQPLLHGLLEPFDLPAGRRVVRSGVLLHHAEALQLGLEAVASALAAGEPGGEDHAVVGQRGGRDSIDPNSLEE